MHTPDLKNVYSVIGMTLEVYQSVERVLRFTITFAFHGVADGLTAEHYERMTRQHDKATLGRFVQALRARAVLHPDFESLLTRVLTERNQFVHRWTDIEGWDLGTEEGCAFVTRHCLQLIRHAHYLQEILVAMIHEWANQQGLPPLPMQDGVADYFQQLSERHGKYLNDIFFHGSDEAGDEATDV